MSEDFKSIILQPHDESVDPPTTLEVNNDLSMSLPHSAEPGLVTVVSFRSNSQQVLHQ